MNKYNVYMTYSIGDGYTVEAKNRKEAQEKALDRFHDEHPLSGNYELVSLNVRRVLKPGEQEDLEVYTIIGMDNDGIFVPLTPIHVLKGPLCFGTEKEAEHFLVNALAGEIAAVKDGKVSLSDVKIRHGIIVEAYWIDGVLEFDPNTIYDNYPTNEPVVLWREDTTDEG